MLLELRVENYAVIDNVAVEFAPGLNLLTGETGAGKSILIDALALLLGDKASSDAVRHGTDKAIVSAVFEVESPAIDAVLEANGIDAEDGQIILRREIAAGGKGRVFINNQPATVTVLKQLAPHLAVIHAQNEAVLAFDRRLAAGAAGYLCRQRRFRRRNRLSIDWNQVRRRIADLERDETRPPAAARPVELSAQRNRRRPPAARRRREARGRKARAGQRRAGSRCRHGGLRRAVREQHARRRRRFAQPRARLKSCPRFDEQFRDAVPELESARITVEDIGTRLRDYADGIEASPERLAEVEDRLAALDRLKRKYGPKLEDVIALGDELERKLNEMENKDEVLRKLRLELATGSRTVSGSGASASRQRYEAARKLEKLVESEINELAMKARFKVEVSGSDEEGNWTARGFDQVQYLISANPGEPLGPVDEIASGGELSRVMLALKTSIEAGSRARRQRVGAINVIGKRRDRTTDAGLRRDRCRHWRTRGRSGGQEAEAALAHQAGAVHHPSAADRVLRRPALPD